MTDIVITERTAAKPTVDTTVNLKLPEIAWRGSFKDYREMVAPTTEAADEFHFSTYAQGYGCTLGHDVHVYHAGELYPNLYTCNVGRSGLTRKDTALSRGRKVLDGLHVQVDDEQSPPFKLIAGMRSYEGLLDELAGENKVRLIQQGELLSLLSKARQDSLSNIIPALTELYDCPSILNPPVHQKQVKPAIRPFVSIMAGTTQEWLQKALTERDIYGGFANRWCYFCGTPKEPMPDPPKVDKQKLDNVIQQLNTTREWARNVPYGEVTVSDEAKERFETYYRDYYCRCQQPGLIPTLIVRIQDFIWKFALLYAVDEQQAEISAEHLEAAIAVGDYLEACVSEVFSNFGASSGKAEETRLVDLLRSSGKITERDLYRRLGLSAKQLENTIQPLIKLGLVTNSYITAANGRKVRTFELAT